MTRVAWKGITVRAVFGTVSTAIVVVVLAVCAGAAGKESLVQERDLPAGTMFSSGFPKTELGYTPTYPTVADCALDYDNRFSRTATVHVAVYVDERTGGTELSGDDQIYDFTNAATAKKFYAASRSFFSGAPKCEQVTTSSGRELTYRSIDVGDVGDEHAAVVTSDRSGYAVYSATFLRGKSVVRVTSVGKVSRGEFAKFVKRAATRFDAAR